MARRVYINLKGLKAEIEKKGFPQLKEKTEPLIKKSLDQETKKMLTAFDQHPVTTEIEGGESAQNSSGTLGGYGNLFTFIGFDKGSDPISPLRSLLARSFKITSIRKRPNKFGLIIKFTMPTKEQIAAVTPSPWSTDSWLEAIERGMAGVGRYLYSSNSDRFSTSRSGGAIQANVEVRASGSSKPIDYLTGILTKMLRDVEKSLDKL